MAFELGLFKKFGLQVRLSRELGWASVRDKIIFRELDASHAVAGLPFAATLGVGSIPCDCVTGVVLNLHGNAISLSHELWRHGVRDGVSLRAEIGKQRGKKVFTFGAVHHFSSHYFLLRKWLLAAGIHPDRDVRIVVVPPPQMAANLKAGHIDGFCVGEPWNSVALQSKSGYLAAVSAELDPGHPEKVLMVRREFAENRSEEHLALIGAILEAAEWCDLPANRAELASVLARPEYVGVPVQALRQGLEGEFVLGSFSIRKVSDFFIFHRHEANEPSADKAAWALHHIRQCGLCPDVFSLDAHLARRVFRSDIYFQACHLRERMSDMQPAAQPADVPVTA